MNTFARSVAMGVTTTANGMLAFNSTGDVVLDFFGNAGSARNMKPSQLKDLFDRAYAAEPELAVKALFWLRDVRGGAGERQAFRDLIHHVSETNPVLATAITKFVPEYGRWDDGFTLVGAAREVFKRIATDKLLSNDPALVAKWMPRQGVIAREMQKFLKLSPKAWRKLVVHASNTVEQSMCAKDWENINFEHVPSVAATRYQAAFIRNSKEAYPAYREALKNGTAKINAAALFPHNITQQIHRTSGDRDDILSAQWKALPNFLEESQERILPMIDVSASMSCTVGGNPNLQCMDVSVGLGAYIALKQPGVFEGMYLTFESDPQLCKAEGDVCQMIRDIYIASWGGSTALDRAVGHVLKYALAHQVPANEMPTMLMVLSDMQFNECGNKTAIGMFEEKYRAAGYELPTLVWWNLNAEYGGVPCGADSENMMLVSGFSPAILKAVVNRETMPPVPTPRDLMLQVLNSERYEAIKV